MTDTRVLSQRSLRRRFFRLTWLSILSNITVPLAGLVDTAMLGHLAEIRFLAGVALASVLFEYVYWSFGFLRMGATGMTAQAVGRTEPHEVHLLLYRFLLIAIAIGAGLLLLQVPLRELGFGLLSGSPDVEAAGREYFNARIWGAPAVLCNFVLLGWFLGREESQRCLWMNVVANIANVCLNYLFIIRLDMAARGAGLATMCSQYLMLVSGLLFLARVGKGPPLSWADVLERRQIVDLMRLNRDILVRTLGVITTFGLFTNFSAVLGTAMLAANAILLRFLNIGAFAIDGVAFAAESLAGQLKGRGDAGALRRMIHLTLGTSFGMALVFVAIFEVSGTGAWRLVTSHEEILELVHSYRFLLYSTLLVGSLAYAYDGIFLGLTAGRLLRNAMLIGTMVFLVPAVAGVYWRNNALLWNGMLGFMVARTWILGWFGRRLTRLEGAAT